MCRFGYSFCIHSFVKNIPFLQFPIEFHKKSIPNFFFFCLCCSCTTFRRSVSCQCVHRDFEVFRPLALLLCRPILPPRSQPGQSWFVSEHVSCIHPDSFHGSPALHINIVCRMGTCGRSCVEPFEYLLFKGLVPYAVLVRREQRCVFGTGRCRADTVSLTGWASKSHSWLPPYYLFQSRKAQVRSHRSSVCLCVCVSVMGFVL